MMASASASSPNSVSCAAAATIRERSIAGSLYGICARSERKRPLRMFLRLFLRTNSSNSVRRFVVSRSQRNVCFGGRAPGGSAGTSGSSRPIFSPTRSGSAVNFPNRPTTLLGAPPLRALVELGHRARDVAGEVTGECLVRDLDGVVDRAPVAAAVSLDERMREAEQRRAAVLLPVGDFLELIDRAGQCDQAEPPREAFLVRVTREANHRFGDALEHLQDDVADEAAGDEDIGDEERDIETLDDADE